MIFVDTNVLSETFGDAGDPQVLKWLIENGPHLWLSTIVMAEMHYGVEKLPPSRRRSALEDWVGNLFDEFEGRIASFDEIAAAEHGALLARMKRMGSPMPLTDSYIAAIALAHDAPVATRNWVDFENSGAVLINPWDA